MRSHSYLVVEGPHDVEFVYRLLSPFGLRRIQYENQLDNAFHPLIPRNYPPNGDLQKRMPVPLFLQSESHAIAVHSAIGDSRLVDTVVENATPGLLATSRSHVAAALQSSELTSDDLKDIQKPAGKNKAVIGAMASVLRPGKAVQVSLQDNRWLKGAALESPRIKAVQDFLKALFGLA
jgi:hypothetical protein